MPQTELVGIACTPCHDTLVENWRLRMVKGRVVKVRGKETMLLFYN